MMGTRRLRDAERGELHSPWRRLDAYYYSFSETGSVPVDAILSAIAIAGKSCHTNAWTDDHEWSWWGEGRSLVDVIQGAAYEAADALLGARAEVERLTAMIDAVREVHSAASLEVPYCVGCDAESDVFNTPWPCPAIRILDGAES